MGLLAKMIEKRDARPISVKINEYLEDLVFDVKELPYTIKYDIKRFIYRAKKLLDFIKLGWNDEDYDSEFISDLIRYKLDTMSEYFIKSGHAKSNERNAKRMRVASKALKQWHRYDFSCEYDRRHSIVEFEYDMDQQYLVKVYKGTKTPLSPNHERIVKEQTREANKYEKRMKKRYKKIFFKIMYNHYLKFWD
jgi:hypothetical protein